MKVINIGDFIYDKSADSLPKINNIKGVSLITTDKPLSYRKGNSRIVYIGQTTKQGLKEILTNLRDIVLEFLKSEHKKEINKISTNFIVLSGNIEPCKIESAFIYLFKEIYGEKPKFNIHGTGFSSKKLEYLKEYGHGYSESDLKEILKSFESV